MNLQLKFFLGNFSNLGSLQHSKDKLEVKEQKKNGPNHDKKLQALPYTR